MANAKTNEEMDVVRTNGYEGVSLKPIIIVTIIITVCIIMLFKYSIFVSMMEIIIIVCTFKESDSAQRDHV